MVNRNRRRLIFVAVAGLLVLFLNVQLLQVQILGTTSTRNVFAIIVERLDLFRIRNFDFEPSLEFGVHEVSNTFGVSCAGLILGNESVVNQSIDLMNTIDFRKFNIPDYVYINLTKDCQKFISIRGYITRALSQEEASFPIAFSILMYKEVEQAERLLRAIYRPQNLYCFHVDLDASDEVLEATKGIANCFDNVFVVTKKERVVYRGFSRLQAELNCMNESLEHKNIIWKYFINLPSQQFPIRTNGEIVKILKLYNGTSDIEGLTGNRRLEERFLYHHEYQNDTNNGIEIVQTKEKKTSLPFKAEVVKGSAYGVFSRAFVEFALRNQTALKLLEWLKDVDSPDEYFWATLNFNPSLGAPGSYTGTPDKKDWLAVYAAWNPVDVCFGKWVRGVCVFGVRDLASLVWQRELFVNKFYLDFEPLALFCLEEWHRNVTLGVERSTYNWTTYTSLNFVNR